MIGILIVGLMVWVVFTVVNFIIGCEISKDMEYFMVIEIAITIAVILGTIFLFIIFGG